MVMGVAMLGNEHCGLDDSLMVLLSWQQLLKANADITPVDLDQERESFLKRADQQELCLDGLPFFAIEPEVRKWLSEKTQRPFPEGALSVVLGPENRPTGRAIADFGSFEAATHALKMLDCGRAIECGRWEGSPHGPKERILLARPLRRQEREFTAPVQSLVPLPAGSQALAAMRQQGKGSGKGRGICFQGRNCVRMPPGSCRFTHPDGRIIDESGR